MTVGRSDQRRRGKLLSDASKRLLQELDYSFRVLRTAPGFALTAIFILALGIGAATVIYAFVDAAMVKPLPYREPALILALFERNPVGDRFHLSDFDYRAWKQLNHVFASVDVYRPERDTLNSPEGPIEVSGAMVSDGFFRTLGVSPEFVRDFLPGEDLSSSPRTAILSDAAWRHHFGGDPHVIGHSVMLNGESFAVVGVLPPNFHFAPAGKAEFWTTTHGYCEKLRDCFPFYGVARLRDKVSIAAATQDVNAIARQIATDFPQFNRDRGATVVPMADVILGTARPLLLGLLSGAGLLCLVAFVNVSSLLLMRAERSKRDAAIRATLGASRIRLLRGFAIEAVLLSSFGCTLSLLFAKLSLGICAKQIPANLIENMPYVESAHLNARSILFSVAISMIGGILFATTPMVHFLLSDLRNALINGGRGIASNMFRKFGSILVSFEIATTIVLLIGAGLLTKSFYRLVHVDVGAQDADHLALIHVSQQGHLKWPNPANIQLERRLIAQTSTIPGVSAVGASGQPLIASAEGFKLTMAHYRAIERPTAGLGPEPMDEIVSVGYFETLGAHINVGRGFNEADDSSRPRCAVINETLAKEFFPDGDAVGKHILSAFDPDHPIEVVGIISDIKDGALDLQPIPAVYRPFNQVPVGDLYLTVRTSELPGPVLTTMAKTVRRIDPTLIVNEAETLSARIDNSEAAYFRRAAAWVATGFAVIATLLGITGLSASFPTGSASDSEKLGFGSLLVLKRTPYSDSLSQPLRSQ